MIKSILTITALCLSTSAIAQQAAVPAPETQVSESSLRSMVEALVGFGTRHTLSEQDNPVRGIGAARRWAEAEFRRISADCGGCLTVQLPEQMIQGNRVPVPTRLVNVLGVQLGTERPNEVVIISGHIDSRVSDVMNATADAPGANDDASGTAAVIEAARVLSRHRFSTTIVYAVLSGEEQGLYGGRLLAAHATAQGWTVKAQLNNDIIGGTRGSDGVIDDAHVRVFSEGPRADSTDAYRASARREGGENDSPSRNLSRFIAGLSGPQPGLPTVRQVFRADRFGRGGDQLPMQEAGYPAVRLSVAIEDYDHQHQDLRTENGTVYGDTIDEMDFPYLARVTALNVRALAALARAPMPPAPRVEGAVSVNTTLSWEPVVGAAAYRIYQRRTDERDWRTLEAPVSTATSRLSATLNGIRVDDWVFGISSVASDGSESPVASAVPGGAFAPLPR
ncbi:M20/M25/M40 family metallo-hydrolase [Sphingomonas lacunae]|uniref:M20/M25/M40 family metallo-hydrolase n=1 Tax=Sphingomonas lacunae TaxID=2698828 RepID=A0A6M4AVJ6_9SPHN|nr:M28 family peptidase [Sphingomonas lacunae]QJQ33104.1 M20/M25/M40 family metallo-hydrolase [Sphingomonas lacunae]